MRLDLLLCILFPVTALAASLGPGLSNDQLNYVKDDPKITHLVSFDIAGIDTKGKAEPLGTLELALFGEKLPITVNHFVEYALSKTNGYQNSIFHRIVKDFVVQGGNLMRVNRDYKPIEFTTFADEAFPLKHNKMGRLSMANSGADTNGCQFFITTSEKPFTHLDGKHVVFGQLILGFETLQTMNKVETIDSKPVSDITITRSRVSMVLSTGSALGSIEETSVSPGYKYLIIMCGIIVAAYMLMRYKGRRTLVDLTSFKM
ncbi:hypothetical protein PUMCH_004249 [Australozyma saopauloensis]|uniref:Peptidyl-prolyl cis-trans isomerase n=1 Tax=Australozyma saopauloensis TaxID=291208 RepID=A0AAX4HEQ4_9ASCO|nr:hypothetical protein PUMCH_004249 [[Candida] saopauloensis]